MWRSRAHVLEQDRTRSVPPPTHRTTRARACLNGKRARPFCQTQDCRSVSRESTYSAVSSTVSRSIRRRRLAYTSSHTPVPTHTDRGPRTRRPKRLAFARRAAARPARLRHWLFGFVLRRPPPYRYIGAAAGPGGARSRPVPARRPAGLDSRLTSGLRRVPFRVRGYIRASVVARLRPVTSRHSPHAARKGELYEGDCIQSGVGVPLPDNAAARCEDRTRCTGAQLRYRRDTRNDLLISFPDSTRLNDY